MPKMKDQEMYESTLEWCEEFIGSALSSDRLSTKLACCDSAIRCLQNARNILKSTAHYTWEYPKKGKRHAKHSK